MDEIGTCSASTGCMNKTHTSGQCYQKYREFDEPPAIPMTYHEWLMVTREDESCHDHTHS